MDELSMEQVSPVEAGHFTSHNSQTPSPVIMTNGISSPSELSDMSTDLNSPFSPKLIICPSPVTTLQRASWHSHVYAKPAKAPTHHSICDILGLQRSSDNDTHDCDTEDFPAPLTPAGPLSNISTIISPPPPPIQMQMQLQIPMSIPMPMPPMDLTLPQDFKDSDVSDDCSSIASPPPPEDPYEVELYDEPLNLTVKRRSPPLLAPPETNNNRPMVLNGKKSGGGGFGGNNHLNKKIRERVKSEILLPNNVIIPKVKHPKIPSLNPKNGTRNNSKNKVQDCFKMEGQCFQCIQMGCFYYQLTQILNKTLCWPAHISVPHPGLIDHAYKHESKCPTAPQPSYSLPTIDEKTNDQSNYNRTDSPTSWTAIIIIGIVVILFVFTLTICFIHRRMVTRPINSAPTIEGMEMKKIPIPNLSDLLL